MAGGRPFQPGNKFGPRFQPGQSGNPAGIPASRRQFEQTFYAALVGEGSPEEAARLLWQCARAKEPWAVQLLLQRLAPQESTIRLRHEVEDGGTDWAKLTDGELETIERILERANGAAAQLESGESETEPA